MATYKKGLAEKCKTFVEELAKVGIETARHVLAVDDDEHKGYGKYITFRTDVDPEKYGCRAVLVASNTGLIRSVWRTNNTATGITEADVSPILMAEFGSGLMADNQHASQFGMGTGTFPGQTHAEDPTGWWYQTLDYEWHHSYGVTPSYPMMNAANKMFDEIGSVTKRVFG